MQTNFDLIQPLEKYQEYFGNYLQRHEVIYFLNKDKIECAFSIYIDNDGNYVAYEHRGMLLSSPEQYNLPNENYKEGILCKSKDLYDLFQTLDEKYDYTNAYGRINYGWHKGKSEHWTTRASRCGWYKKREQESKDSKTIDGTTITVLPAEEPKKLKTGWTIYEFDSHLVYGCGQPYCYFPELRKELKTKEDWEKYHALQDAYEAESKKSTVEDVHKSRIQHQEDIRMSRMDRGEYVKKIKGIWD